MAGDFIGGMTLNAGDDTGAPPAGYTAVGGVADLSGFGQTNDLVEVTDFDSGSSKEYISGLADGEEITVVVNANLASTQHTQFRTDSDNKASRNFEIVMTDGTDTITFTFRAAVLGWALNPSFSEANQMTFNLKISGSITES